MKDSEITFLNMSEKRTLRKHFGEPDSHLYGDSHRNKSNHVSAAKRLWLKCVDSACCPASC